MISADETSMKTAKSADTASDRQMNYESFTDQRMITLLFSYKNLVYKNIKALNCSKIKNIAVILLVAISISFEGFGKEMTFL